MDDAMFSVKDVIEILLVLGAIVAAWIALVRRIDAKVSKKDFEEKCKELESKISAPIETMENEIISQGKSFAEMRIIFRLILEKLGIDSKILENNN
ncbi:MAG: hypothetical protein EPO24_09360 [Bacteroidetes bacterium]|nr:MAG: hypothetical protein EPO24_09360 [Bacteroidota bacterium]